jgi:DNA-binding transcriptional MerR regulator
MGEEYRLDDLARKADVASTTVRLYRQTGLLAPPRLVGRTGWYDDSHLSRLRLIARLQDQGYSLAGIGDLLAKWEEGRSLDSVVGVEGELDALLGGAHAVIVEPADLAARFPALTPELIQRAAALGAIELTDDGQLRVPDERFIETGSALADLGVPMDVILDEWEALLTQTDEVAARFIDLFEQHLAPKDWQSGLTDAEVQALAGTLAQLQATARQVLLAALDASVAKLGQERLGQLLEEDR